jgi:hypothetical protein
MSASWAWNSSMLVSEPRAFFAVKESVYETPEAKAPSVQ